MILQSGDIAPLRIRKTMEAIIQPSSRDTIVAEISCFHDYGQKLALLS